MQDHRAATPVIPPTEGENWGFVILRSEWGEPIEKPVHATVPMTHEGGREEYGEVKQIVWAAMGFHGSSHAVIVSPEHDPETNVLLEHIVIDGEGDW